jgi:hypothetical protein
VTGSKFEVDALDLTEADKSLLEIISGFKGAGLFFARSAVRHINRAYKIVDLDPEMAVLRLITAEEEAASAIFSSLQRRRYAQASDLNKKSHTQKMGFYAFLKTFFIFCKKFPELEKYNPRVLIDKSNKEVFLEFDTPVNGVSAKPVPPLNFSISTQGGIYDFIPSFKEFCSKNNVNGMRRYVEDMMSIRSAALYAKEDSLPQISMNKELYMKEKKETVFSVLTVYAMIDPYKEKQMFPTQAIAAFLNILNITFTQEELAKDLK